MEFIDPRTTPFQPPAYRGQLPHLYKAGGCYFVTFRLADAIIPLPVRKSIPAHGPRELNPESIAAPYEPRLTVGSCALKDPQVATVVQDALRFFDGKRYLLAAWCIMPNHVHVIFSPLPPHSVSEILKSWKGFTARRANQLLNRSGSFWGVESFDHLIRSPEHFEQFVAYIHNNPVRAGLCAKPEEWPYSSMRAGFHSATEVAEQTNAGQPCSADFQSARAG
jgi:putative transposase